MKEQTLNLDTLTRPPWTVGTYATAEEYLGWLDQQTPENRLALVARLLEDSHAADLCIMADHAGYPRQVASLTDYLASTLTKLDRWRRLARRQHTPRRPLP